MLRFACKMVACDSAADLLAEYGYVESGLGPGSTVKLFRVLAPLPPRHSECGLGPRNDLPPSHMGRKGFVSCPGGPKADQSAQSLFVLESKEA